MPDRSYHRIAVRSILTIAILSAAAPAVAQQKDEQLWLQVNTNVPLGEGFRLTLEQIAPLRQPRRRPVPDRVRWDPGL